MSLLAKKNKDLTTEDTFSLYRAIGTSELPYPASHFSPGADGHLQMEIGIIADDSQPLTIYADMPHDHVVGLLYREMAIPSLLHVQKEAILRRSPDSKNRLMAIMGDPGSGKSHMAKMMGRVRDPRGAEVVDCGGRYMGDLLFEQVIDFGEDFKSALTERIVSGSLSPRSIKIFDEEFAGALQRDGDEKITGIDWDKIGVPKDKGDKEFESTAEAVTRAMDLIEGTIAKWESIPSQTVNTVGVRKQLGVIPRAYNEGFEVVLDEYTKSIEGSDDSLQTVLQFMTGEIDEAVVENSMKVNGRDETYAFTFRRKDMKPGFFVTMTGNKDTDGHSTHTLSRSAYSRINPFTIEDPLAVDWKHRISQIMTGLPLSTLYSVFSDMAQEDNEEFGEMMVELRLMGLSDEESAKIPTHQLTMLRNWQETNAAVEKLADFYMYWSRIIDPNSNLFEQKPDENDAVITARINAILPEVDYSFRDESSMDFRKIIYDLSEASRVKPKIQSIKEKTNLRINFSAVGRKQSIAQTISPEVVASEFGTRLEQHLIESIYKATGEKRPNLQRDLLREATDRGIITVPGQDNETISKLLNQDMFAHMGGIKNISALRTALGNRMRIADPSLQGKSDDEVVPLDQAAALCEEVSRMSINDNDNPHVGRIITLGDDLGQAFHHAAAVDGIETHEHKPSIPQASQLVRTSDFLETLKVPTLANINMCSIWRRTLSNDDRIPNTPEYAPLIKIAEGTHESKIGVTTVMTQDDQGQAVATHVMIDGDRKQSLIVTDSVDDETRATLGKNYKVVTYDEADAEEKVQAFVNDTLTYNGRHESPELEGQLVAAFIFRAGDKRDIGALPAMMTDQSTEAARPVYMVNQIG